jgi:hypothetical protein
MNTNFNLPCPARETCVGSSSHVDHFGFPSIILFCGVWRILGGENEVAGLPPTWGMRASEDYLEPWLVDIRAVLLSSLSYITTNINHPLTGSRFWSYGNIVVSQLLTLFLVN